MALQFHASVFIFGEVFWELRASSYSMNCYYHNDQPAVVACVKCGVGLCRECMTDAPYTYDGKPVCLNCSESIAEQELEDARKEKMWALIKFIFSGFFIAIALLALNSGAGIENVWIVAGIAGIPTAFKATRRSREERLADEIHDRLKGDMMDLMFGWVIRLLVKLAFIVLLAPICAVFTCISNLVSFIKGSKKIKDAQETLDYIQSCLNPSQSMPSVQQYPVIEIDNENQASMVQSSPATSYKSSAPSYATSIPTNSGHSGKKSATLVVACVVGALALIGIITAYFTWYVPMAEDRDAPRSYVVANNVFLRSSKVAGVEYNMLSKVPYGSELIVYSSDPEWSEIKVNGVRGFVATPYLLDGDDFNLLHGLWGSADAREYIESTKCRLALLDYCKRNDLATGNDGWQLYTMQKDVKPNNVLYPRLTNGYDKFTEFAFILKNNATKERRTAVYSFDEETERPIFLYEEIAPAEGQIKDIKYKNDKFNVIYTH